MEQLFVLRVNGKESQPMAHHEALLLLDGLAKRTRNRTEIVPYQPRSEARQAQAESQYRTWRYGPSADEAARLARQTRLAYRPTRLDVTLAALA